MRAAIVDDHGIFRNAVARYLRDVGVDVPINVASGDELLTRMRTQAVDVVILDVAMPPTYTNEGIGVARLVKEQHPTVGVLVLSAETATPEAIGLLRDFTRGIGYLRKDEVDAADDLEATLARLVAGEQVMGRSIVTRLLRSAHRETPLARLSKQERGVLQLMAEGFSNAGIARHLRLKERTVEDHVGKVFAKLGIESEAAPGGRADGNKRVLAVLTWLRFTTSQE